VISGTGSFEGATGSGPLKVQWDDAYRRGTETYTGAITRQQSGLQVTPPAAAPAMRDAATSWAR
jgi:hypothetical protein